jgi:hypothetical protein
MQALVGVAAIHTRHAQAVVLIPLALVALDLGRTGVRDDEGLPCVECCAELPALIWTI